MPIQSPLAFPFILVVAAMAAILVLRFVPFFQRILAAETAAPARYPMLDGLRGVLALCVVACHAYGGYLNFQMGVPTIAGQEGFYIFLGDGGVAQFFMITGFLFWGRAIDRKIDILNHYYSRAWRIGPLFLTIAAAAMVYVAVASQGRLYVKPFALMGQISSYLMLGLLPTAPINGIDVIAFFGPAWTLRAEWKFYLLLPFIAFLATTRGFLLIFCGMISAWIVLYFLGHERLLRYNYHLPLFLMGMTAAHLVRLFPVIGWLKSRWVSLLMLVPAALAVRTSEYSPSWFILHGLLFIPVVYGNSFFGLLGSRAFRFLGTISYSIYLLHAPLLRAMVLALADRGILEKLTPIDYWLAVGLFTTVLIPFCALSYRFVEFPHLHRRLKIRYSLTSKAVIPGFHRFAARILSNLHD